MNSIKRELIEKFRKLLNDENITQRQLCTEIVIAQNPKDLFEFDDKKEKEYQNLQASFQYKERNLPIRYIKALKDILQQRGDINAVSKCSEIFNLWKQIEELKTEETYKRFFQFETEELLWLINNSKTLSKIYPKHAYFLTHILALTDDTKIKIRNMLIYTRTNNALGFNELDMQETTTPIKYQWKFMGKSNYSITDEIDCFAAIKDIDLIPQDVNEKKELIKCWLNFREMSELDSSLLRAFIQYDTAKIGTLTHEQAYILGIVKSFSYMEEFYLD